MGQTSIIACHGAMLEVHGMVALFVIHVKPAHQATVAAGVEPAIAAPQSQQTSQEEHPQPKRKSLWEKIKNGFHGS